MWWHHAMSPHPRYSSLAICDDTIKSQVAHLIILANHLWRWMKLWKINKWIDEMLGMFETLLWFYCDIFFQFCYNFVSTLPNV
jgi:hypothetical protein